MHEDDAVKTIRRWQLLNCVGFTFVEMMIAATVFAIVMGTLYTCLRTGLRAYAAAYDRCDQLHLLRSLERDLNQDFTSAYTDKDEFPQAFLVEKKTDAVTISFCSVPSERQLRTGSIGDLRLVKYSLVKISGTREMKLERTIAPIVAKQVLDEGEPEILFENMKSAEFSFFDGQTWTKEWIRTDVLPKSVRLEFSISGSVHPCRMTVEIPAAWNS